MDEFFLELQVELQVEFKASENKNARFAQSKYLDEGILVHDF